MPESMICKQLISQRHFIAYFKALYHWIFNLQILSFRLPSILLTY